MMRTWAKYILLLAVLSPAPGLATEIPLALLDVPRIPICGVGKRATCVVDGDTVWIAGVKYRFEEIDAPERGTGAACRLESYMAMEATIRLANILSTNGWRIETKGMDRYGRVLARFVIGDTTAGEMLVANGLARQWSGRKEDWCQ